MLIDSHLHVWRASAATSAVATHVGPEVDVPIEDAAAVLDEHGVKRAVLVQPIYPGEDNSYIAACARAQGERFAAVCVVDPRTPGAEHRLADWVGQGCRGLRLRPRIAAEASTFGDPGSFPLWEEAARLKVVVSVLSAPEHNEAIASLAARFPQVPIVVDHLGHPDVTAGIFSAGFQQLLALAARENVLIKLSGFYHFSREAYPFRDCWELVRAVYDAFGPARLLWGSDYPHVTVTCGYRGASELLDEAGIPWNTKERNQVMGRNALRLYWPRRRI
jgi:predicted TIM-barrel fold metal-dependent hydrolase